MLQNVNISVKGSVTLAETHDKFNKCHDLLESIVTVGVPTVAEKPLILGKL